MKDANYSVNSFLLPPPRVCLSRCDAIMKRTTCVIYPSIHQSISPSVHPESSVDSPSLPLQVLGWTDGQVGWA